MATAVWLITHLLDMNDIKKLDNDWLRILKMDDRIIIMIGGLLLSALTYFAGVYRTDRRYRKQEKERRIENVLNRYMEFRNTRKVTGLDGLQKAGIGTLKNDKEMREVVDLIMKYGERDPLERPEFEMDGIDLKVFFEEATNKNLNFLHSKNLRILIDSVKNA